MPGTHCIANEKLLLLPCVRTLRIGDFLGETNRAMVSFKGASKMDIEFKRSRFEIFFRFECNSFGQTSYNNGSFFSKQKLSFNKILVCATKWIRFACR